MPYYYNRRIDTHFHVLPDFYAEAIAETGGYPSGLEIPSGWSIEQARIQMTNLGIENAVSLVAAPSTSLYSNDIEKARIVANRCNIFCEQLANRERETFGYFVTRACIASIYTPLVVAQVL
jgi:6-methylsalicylate decarboxylase